MTTKRTILSENEASLLESLIRAHGLVVTSSQIFAQLSRQKNRQVTRNLISKLAASGWLVRLKRGLYFIANLESRGQAQLSTLAIAQLLDTTSYISFEAALQYYGMFDQYLRTIRSITLMRTKKISVGDIEFTYYKAQKKYCYGFQEIVQDGQRIKIAVPEKAILDLLRLRRSAYVVDLVDEKLREYSSNFDLKLLLQYAYKETIATQRILGFILDRNSIDTEALFRHVQRFKGYSIMTSDSKRFDSKWRLYYHAHFDKKNLS